MKGGMGNIMKQAQQMQEKAEQVQMAQLDALAQQAEQGWAKLNADMLDAEHDNDLDDEKFQWQKFTDFEDLELKEDELELEEKQDRQVGIG